jgi:hypothetical protein
MELGQIMTSIPQAIRFAIADVPGVIGRDRLPSSRCWGCADHRHFIPELIHRQVCSWGEPIPKPLTSQWTECGRGDYFSILSERHHHQDGD